MNSAVVGAADLLSSFQSKRICRQLFASILTFD